MQHTFKELGANNSVNNKIYRERVI